MRLGGGARRGHASGDGQLRPPERTAPRESHGGETQVATTPWRPGGGCVFSPGAMDSHRMSQRRRRVHSLFNSSRWEEVSDRPKLRDVLRNNSTGLLKNAKAMTGKDRPGSRQTKNVPSERRLKGRDKQMQHTPDFLWGR